MNTTTSYLRAIGRERELLFLVAQRDSTLAAYQAQEPCPHGLRTQHGDAIDMCDACAERTAGAREADRQAVAAIRAFCAETGLRARVFPADRSIDACYSVIDGARS